MYAQEVHLLFLLLPTACKPVEDAQLPACEPAPSAEWTSGPRFEDRTGAWGITAEGGRLQAVDLDGDRYPDLVVTQVFSNARDDLEAGVRYHYVLLNRPGPDGGRVFEDHTEATGLIQNRDGGVGTAATLFTYGDVDGDGDLDAFAGRYYDEGTTDATGDCSEILLNDGSGHFSFAPASDPCDPDGHPVTGASFTDYDGDGHLDLWATMFYVEYGYIPAAQDQLYRGNGDGTFTAVTEDAGLTLKQGRSTADWLERDIRRPAYGATACDLDGDARPELLASNYGRSWNQLWRNEDGTFTEIGEESGWASDDNLDYSDNYMYACWYESEGTAADPEPSVDCGGAFPASYWSPGWDDQPARLGGNTFTTVCADIDNDGDNDLFDAAIVHDWAGGSADASQLLLNDGDATFDRIDNEENGLARDRPARRSWNEGDLHAAFFDFDNDGWKDILLGSSDYEEAPGQFEEVTAEVGLEHPWPAGLAVADFDLDGDLDVATGSSTARTGTPWTVREVHLYENTGPAGNWARIEGLSVGTRVDLTAGGITQSQEVSGGYGHAGIQNDTALHFGLGEGCHIDTVTVTSPDGTLRTWEDLPGNQVLVLE
jgi:hypothetical protein